MADQMFGLIVAGRPPESFKQIGEAEFMCELQSVDTVNHLVVFMTGTQLIPDGYAASVYICWQTSGDASSWNYLGAIGNVKPSSIFKISQIGKGEGKSADLFGNVAYSGAQGIAQVGIKVEPIHIVESLQAETSTKATNQSTLAEFGEKMVQNLVNHAESYAVRLPKSDGIGYSDYIPITALQQWVKTFTRRFQQNPYFWKSLSNS